MKIFHLITDLDIGGAEMMLDRLLSSMDTGRFVNAVISMTDDGILGKVIRARGVTVHNLGMRKGIPDPKGLWRLILLLRREKPDILQTWLYHADLIGTLAGWLTRAPSIIWNIRCSELSKEDHHLSLFWILRFLAKLSGAPRAVIVNSEAGRAAHERLGYKPVRWEIIPNGFDTARFKPDETLGATFRRSMGFGEKDLLVGLIGRYHPMKDHTNFLTAARLVAERLPEAHFILTGRDVDWSNAHLVSMIKSVGLEHRIHLLGERSDIHAVNIALDVACSSSYSEGFPTAVGEAMACGVPCVVTEVGDSAGLVGGTGFVVPPRDPAAMAAALEQMLKMDRDRRREMGLAARERIEAFFSIEQVTRRYESLYEEIHAATMHRGKG